MAGERSASLRTRQRRLSKTTGAGTYPERKGGRRLWSATEPRRAVVSDVAEKMAFFGWLVAGGWVDLA